jgi:hypothetical protein
MGVSAGPNKFQEAGRNLEEAGFKVQNGQLTPTQDYGAMTGLASEQRNSLSLGSKPGSVSTLGSPMNSMYAANPGFFQRSGGGGAAAVSPEVARAQNIAAAKKAGTFDIIRDQYNAKGGAQMNELGTIGAAAAAAAPAATAESVAAQRASIQGAAAPDIPAAPAAETGGYEYDPNAEAVNTLADYSKGATNAEMAAGPKPATPAAAAPVVPAPAPAAPAAPSQMDLNRQALEQGAAGIRLRREALGQMPQSITSDRGYKVVTDAKGNIVGTNAPVAPVSSAVGGFADQRAAFNMGKGTSAEKAALGPNIRSAALAELSRPAPKPMAATAPNAGAQMGPPLQGSAQMGPPLQGSAQMGPPLQGSAQMGPPSVPNKPILSTSAPPKMFESATTNRFDLVGPPSNMSRPIQGPPNAAATTPYERMQKTTLGPAKPNGPILSTSAPPKMMAAAPASIPTKDDITKQRASLASTKR